MIVRATRKILSALSLGGVLAVLAASPGASTANTPTSEGLQTAIFAAGCFWCVEADFDKLEGVVETISGYTGGHTKNPTYAEVGEGQTGHTEALLVKFDPAKVTYEKLLDYYWRHVDFLDGDGQFCDRGNQYRPAIFTSGGEQLQIAEASKAALAKLANFDRPIAVEIVPAGEFTPAEDYHQDYYTKNPLKYRYYRTGCGRDRRIAQLWQGIGAGH